MFCIRRMLIYLYFTILSCPCHFSVAYRDTPRKRAGAVSGSSGAGRLNTTTSGFSAEPQLEEVVDENFPVRGSARLMIKFTETKHFSLCKLWVLWQTSGTSQLSCMTIEWRSSVVTIFGTSAAFWLTCVSFTATGDPECTWQDSGRQVAAGETRRKHQQNPSQVRSPLCCAVVSGFDNLLLFSSALCCDFLFFDCLILNFSDPMPQTAKASSSTVEADQSIDEILGLQVPDKLVYYN